jgi:DNA polymerase III alpha subunit
MKFLHLKIHSSYSLSQGEVRIEDLVEFAVENKIPALCIADEGNLFGALEFALEAKKQGIQPIIGVCLMVSSLFDGKAIEGKIQLIAKNEQGYKNLLKLVSKSFLNSSTQAAPLILRLGSSFRALPLPPLKAQWWQLKTYPWASMVTERGRSCLFFLVCEHCGHWVL